MQTILLLLCFSLAFISCSNSSYKDPTFKNDDNEAQQITPPVIAERIAVAVATPVQCAAGGSVYSVYKDKNDNSAMDASDELVHAQIVCNGTNGANGSSGAHGHSSLISTQRVNVGLSACAAGSGLQINFGLDVNDNLVLEPSEITAPDLVCDGETGAIGSAGASGATGTSVIFQTVAASVQMCAAGGSTIIMAEDVDHSHSIGSEDQNIQEVTLCNGSNGANAPVPAYSIVEPIFACGNSVAYKEVLLRLSSGQVLGAFSDNASGAMTRLAFLSDGTFMNTDNSGCTFSLATSGSTRSISWFNQVQMTWSMNP